MTFITFEVLYVRYKIKYSEVPEENWYVICTQCSSRAEVSSCMRMATKFDYLSRCQADRSTKHI